MSTFRSCDYCGEPITDDQFATVDVRFSHPSDFRLNATVGDYHFSRARPCYQALTDAIVLAHDFGGAIEHIPVASSQSVAQRKRKHVKAPLLPPARPADDDGPEAVAVR